MTNAKKQKNRRVIYIMIAALLIFGASVAVLTYQYLENSDKLGLETWDNYADAGYNVSDLTITGQIYGIKTDYTIEGQYSYHKFPALIYLNITKVVWASEQLMSEMGINKLPNNTWSNQDTIVIAYDKEDVPSLTIGESIEASGCYFRLSNSVYGGKLVVAQGVNDSYVENI